MKIVPRHTMAVGQRGPLMSTCRSNGFFFVFFQLEQLEDIKAQTQKLQQENESLSFVVETKSKFERSMQ